ncbi:MAG: hypothetical protein WCZ87_04520 [Thiohalobacteraceae bacterium]
MNRYARMVGLALLTLTQTAQAGSDADLDALRQEIAALKAEYERRIQALEQRLETAAARPARAPEAAPSAALKPAKSASSVATVPAVATSQRDFNPAISLVLDGKLTQFTEDPEDYAIPGFQLGGEAGPGEEGLSVQHSELIISANVDDLFFGQLTAAIASHEDSTEIELEEAYIETAALGSGLNLRAGRFYSGIGYLNQQHAHAWDFADAPLVYRALFGDQLNDDGLQLSWIAPTDLYFTIGAEALRGADFPAAGDAHSGLGAGTLFTKFGGDIGASHSWQLGLSHWRADVIDRVGDGHAHGGGDAVAQVSFNGDSRISALDFVWKWAPAGNATRTNLKLQAEYFQRDEDGLVSIAEAPIEETLYDGRQRGWYAQAVYQFRPRWRVGLRYDRLTADNTGSDAAVLTEAGLDSLGHDPNRYALMFDYSRSEFSRLRLQYNRDRSQPGTDDQFYLQYIMSLGAHGAHAY